MIKYAVLTLALFTITNCENTKQHADPFSVLDQHLTSLAYHSLWPFRQLFKAAAALEDEEKLENPKVVSDPNVYVINFRVRGFKPDELKVRATNRFVTIQGQHVTTSGGRKYVTNQFMQSFTLPPGSRQEEVTAVYENGLLTVSVPRHEVPPPPPERDVPIEVREPKEDDKKENDTPKETAKPEEETTADKAEETTSAKEDITTAVPLTTSTSSASVIELDSEATTHTGKIRKKELKTTTKSEKDNEVEKLGDVNRLDYIQLDADE